MNTILSSIVVSSSFYGEISFYLFKQSNSISEEGGCLKTNEKYFDEFLKTNLPHIHLIEPEGLYLAWVDFRECGLNKDELEKVMLEKAGLWLDEGYIFGTGGEGFERFNLAVPRRILEDACQRLKKVFQEDK